MAAKSKNRKKAGKTSKKKTEQSFVRDEIIIWVTLAICILMLISNFGLGGFVGEAISGFLVKIFGLVAYLFPFLFFVIITFSIANRGNKSAYVKTAAGVLLIVLICTFLQLVHEAGGSLGNILVSLLTPAIGVAGTYVVDIILMIICLVIITGKSALGGVKRQSGRAYEKAKKDVAKRKELSETRKLERQKEQEREKKQEKSVPAKRMNRIIDGVSYDTTLTKKSPEVKEISIDPLDDKAKPSKEKMQDLVIHRSEDPVTVPDPVSSGNTETDVADEQPQEKPKTSRRKPKLDASQTAGEVAEVAAAMAASEAVPKKEYKFPPLSLLTRGKRGGGESDKSLRETAMKLQQTLQTFGVNVTVTNVSCGPSVTRYEIQPEHGGKGQQDCRTCR